MGVVESLPPPSPIEKVGYLSILNLQFYCIAEGYGNLWDSMEWCWGPIEVITILSKAILRLLPSCRIYFGGRSHFSASLQLLDLIKYADLFKPYLYRT